MTENQNFQDLLMSWSCSLLHPTISSITTICCLVLALPQIPAWHLNWPDTSLLQTSFHRALVNDIVILSWLLWCWTIS